MKKFLLLIFIILILGSQKSLNLYAGEVEDRKKSSPPKSPVKIIEEKGPAGHQTIGIDESSLIREPAKETHLTFATLMTWNYEPKGNQKPPENIKKIDGQKIKIMGFMFPLQSGKTIRYFCLLRTTQTCCYGPRPQYNQYIFVEMGQPTTFYRLDPVVCVGRFKVDPSPEEGFIYRLEGEKCEPIEGEKKSKP